MKKLLLSAVSLAVLTGSAIAADLPTRKEPLPAPPPSFTWTGLYGGVNVGYGFSANNAGYGSWAAPSVNVANSGSGMLMTNASGVLGGGQIGYNYQWNPYLVLGFEADAQASDINGNGYGARGAYTGNAIVMGQNNLGIDWFGTARGRIGLTMPGYSNFMIYGTGGFAYGYVNNTASLAYLMTGAQVGQGASGSSTLGNTQTGWTAGGGIEWSPQSFPTWSAKVEYLYTNLGSANQAIYSQYMSAPQYFFGGNRSTQTAFNTVRVGLNWHFNPFVGAPIVAKY
jgi:outer membrane immunogenic protein